MKNNRQRLSANEVNKFTYCPYQWYYERLYGIKELRQMKTELIKSLGLEGKSNSNFDRGNEFHQGIYVKYKLLKFLYRIVFVVMLAALIYFIYKGMIAV